MIENLVTPLMGYQIVSNSGLTVRKQVRFPRSRRRRMRKKWRKRPENFANYPEMAIYVSGRMVVCHPAVLDAVPFKLVLEAM